MSDFKIQEIAYGPRLLVFFDKFELFFAPPSYKLHNLPDPSNQCPAKWNSSEVLHYHLFLEHQVNEQVCDICGTVIKSTYYLEKHKKQVHLQLKEHQCKECPKVYASYEGLTKHVDLIHRKIKRFECEYCGYKTNCNNRLRNHTKTLHTKEPFNCNYCDFISYSHKAHQKHTAKVHAPMKKKKIFVDH